MGDKIEKLKGWMKGLFRFCPEEKALQVVTEDGQSQPGDYEYNVRFKLLTPRYEYTVVAIDRGKDDGYLGCGVSCREPREGEDWTRGRDLADGPFTHETWEKIVHDIIAFELVPYKD